MDLSIIVPVFNESDNVLPLSDEVRLAMVGPWRNYQLVFVDDASTDGTWSRIGEARQRDGRMCGLRHLHRCGQSAALWTGVQFTKTELIATLDGDLQNDPADLPRMIEELDRTDFVSGIRIRREDAVMRRVSSGIARWARRRVLGVDFQDTGCGIRVLRRAALTGIFGFNGLHRFLPILVHGGGYRTLEVPVHHRARVAGVSKYGLWDRLGRGVWDLCAVAWFQRRRWRPVETEVMGEPGLECEPSRASAAEVS